MKILIVGGKSSLSHVLYQTLAPFSEVLMAGRSDCDIELDLVWRPEEFALPVDIDVVVNTVADFGGSSFNAIYSAEYVNALGALKLCHTAKEAGVKHFIQISSTSVYLNDESEYYGIYALSKRHADELVKIYCDKESLPFTILRPSQLYGELDSFRRHQPFLFNTIDKAIQNEDITIFGKRDPLRNYLHARDFCRVITSVIRERVEGVYSCTNQVNSSLLEVANMIIKAAGSNSQVIFDEAMKDMPDNIFPYDDSLYQKIDTYPMITMQDGIDQLIAHRLKNL